jgi:uncharacterized protein YbjT (DUF2867 family)
MATAVLFGASGLIGGKLLPLLVEDSRYDKVRLVGRRALGLAGGKVEEHVVDCANPAPELVGADNVFCCVGTTIKKAGSEDAFRVVDHDYPLALARAAHKAGAGRFLVVTAVGADPKSGVFYNRVKGELETALREISFPRGLRIFHPSMLLGERSESRPAEAVGKAVMGALRFAFAGPLKRYRAIDGADVARALHTAAALPDGDPIVVYEGESLFALTRPDRQ